MLASAGRCCHSILLLPGWVGRAVRGPEWAWLEGLQERIWETGSWVGCSMQTQRQPQTQDRHGCQQGGLGALGTLDRKAQTVSRPRYRVSPELRVVEMWEQSRRQWEGPG